MANTSGIKEMIVCRNGFYFGDPCYALDEKLYNEWLAWGDEREKKEGRWCNDGKFVHDGMDIMVVDSTAYGDGCYGGIHTSYGVDAGCLAVIPLEFCDEGKNFRDGLGWVCSESGTVTVKTDDTGRFRIYIKGELIEDVETGDIEEEEEEYDEETREFWDEEDEE